MFFAIFLIIYFIGWVTCCYFYYRTQWKEEEAVTISDVLRTTFSSLIFWLPLAIEIFLSLELKKSTKMINNENKKQKKQINTLK